jgi:hypothetical protein
VRASLDEVGNPIGGIGHQFAISRRAEEHDVRGGSPVLAELPEIALLAFSPGQGATFRAGHGGRAVQDQNQDATEEQLAPVHHHHQEFHEGEPSMQDVSWYLHGANLQACRHGRRDEVADQVKGRLGSGLSSRATFDMLDGPGHLHPLGVRSRDTPCWIALTKVSPTRKAAGTIGTYVFRRTTPARPGRNTVVSRVGRAFNRPPVSSAGLSWHAGEKASGRVS